MSESPATGSVDPSGGEDHPDEVVRRIQVYLEELKRGRTSDMLGKEEWNQFMRYCESLFLRMVRSHHWPEADCDDGVQELWLMLFNRLPELRYDTSRGDLRDWISTAAEHRLVDQDRSRRIHAMERLGTMAADLLAGREPDPSETFDRKCLRELVLDALADLREQVSSRDYQAFTHRWIEGLSVREIAQRLGMTEPQVWSSHHRTSRKLRFLLLQRAGPGFLP